MEFNQGNEMRIVRAQERTRGFTIVTNDIFRLPSLSMQEKGLLIYLLTLPDNWVLSKAELTRHFSNGRDSVYNTFNRLIKAGFITEEKLRAENGKFGGVNYILHEVPVNMDLKKELEITKTSSSLPHTEKPYTVNPYPEKPYTENTELLNNDILNTELLNTESLNISKPNIHENLDSFADSNESAHSSVEQSSTIPCADKKHTDDPFGISNGISEKQDCDGNAISTELEERKTCAKKKEGGKADDEPLAHGNKKGQPSDKSGSLVESDSESVAGKANNDPCVRGTKKGRPAKKQIKSIETSKPAFKRTDYESVIGAYYANCRTLFDRRLIPKEKPVFNYRVFMRRCKDLFEVYGVETVEKAVRDSINNKWLVGVGYPLGVLLSENVMQGLINGTYDGSPLLQRTGTRRDGQAFVDGQRDYSRIDF